ncbi:ABC transporter substrate-binding protein [Streptomyces sp. NPDC058657]|uniref:ABC transporter substrate-binding protein n=1 Tax=unclassified Streptomyces TaxID=2593676 RepID=UPI00365D2A27
MKASRRLGVLALLAGPTLLLTACNSDATGGGKPGRPVSGGTLTYAVNSEPVNLDPHASSQDVTALFARPVLDSLVSMDESGRIRPWLATSWDISADEKTYTFTLREGVRFHDGTPFDAKAVKANLDHVVDPKTKSEMAAGSIEPYRAAKVTGPRTVAVSLERPHAPLLAALSTPYLGMQSPAALRAGPTALARKLVGSGPFVMESFTPRKGADYQRNEDYDWAPGTASRKGPARLKGLTLQVITEDAARLGALTSGQVDAIAQVPPSAVRQLTSDRRLRITKHAVPGGTYTYYPNTGSGPFKDARVRQAFRDGIDFTTVVKELYFGVFDRSHTPLSPSTPGTAPGPRRLGYDPEGAARLLDEAGWNARDDQGYRTKDGRRLTIRWPFVQASGAREQRSTLAAQIQAEAKKLGIELKLVEGTLGELVQQYSKGDYDLMDLSWTHADGDALRNLFHSRAVSTPERFGQNAARFVDKETDHLLEEALATAAPERREQLYARVQDRVADKRAAFPVYVVNSVVGISAKAQGLAWEPQAYPSFRDAWLIP